MAAEAYRSPMGGQQAVNPALLNQNMPVGSMHNQVAPNALSGDALGQLANGVPGVAMLQAQAQNIGVQAEKPKSFLAGLLKRKPKQVVDMNPQPEPQAQANIGAQPNVNTQLDLNAPRNMNPEVKVPKSKSLFDKNFVMGLGVGFILGSLILPHFFGADKVERVPASSASAEWVAPSHAQNLPEGTVSALPEGESFIDTALATEGSETN